jgi:hypothetical protein
MTPTITREQALCMLFCVEFNLTNVEKLKDRIKNMADIDICYETDPLHPRLIPLQLIYAQPLKFHTYIPSTASSD